MKSYTDIEQSRKLAEILGVESADMIWILANPDLPMIKAIAYKDSEKSKYYEILPAWSLAALLDVIPGAQVNRMANSDKWEASSWDDTDFEPTYHVEGHDNAVDACYELIKRIYYA